MTPAIRTSERFNWIVLITFTTGLIMFILTQTIESECGIMGDKLSLWRTQLDLGINTNWSGWKEERYDKNEWAKIGEYNPFIGLYHLGH